MAAIISNKFRIHNAEAFYESFGEAAATNYYMFIGRPQQWSATTGGGSDAAPPTPVDNVEDEYRQWRDMIAAKRVVASDVSFVIPRRDWDSAGATTYDMYEHDLSASNTANSGATNLFDSTFIVMTDEFKVYKCMWNDGNTASTTKPTGTGNTEFDPGDGYIWKYMYTLTSTQIQNFLTTDFMPVVDTLGTVTGASASTVSAAAVDGEVRRILITTAGAGYTNGTYTAVPIRGDGASGTCTVTIAGGAVTAVVVTAQGTGYTYGAVHVNGITSVGSPSTTAVLTPIIGPKNGHGKDALKELGAFYCMTNTALVGAEGSGDFVVAQDFRRIGLVRNPYNHGTTTVSSATTLSALKSVTFNASPTPGTFTNDEIITGGTTGAKGKVVDWNATTRVLSYYQSDYTGIDANKNITVFAGTEVVTGADSSSTGTMSAVSNPEIAHHSGDIMYTEARAPIVRATDQTENIKLVIEF